MSNYTLPPPLPTYHVLLEGEGLGQSLGNCKDDLLNVCMRHVEKMCKADLSRNFIERNHMENGGFILVLRIFLSQSTFLCLCRFACQNRGSSYLLHFCHGYAAALGGPHIRGADCRNALFLGPGWVLFKTLCNYGAQPSNCMEVATCLDQSPSQGLCILQLS